MNNLNLYSWIQKKASVTYPNKKYWSASVTLGGIDINGAGTTIQKAYESLRSKIKNSKYLFSSFTNL